MLYIPREVQDSNNQPILILAKAHPLPGKRNVASKISEKLPLVLHVKVQIFWKYVDHADIIESQFRISP